MNQKEKDRTPEPDDEAVFTENARFCYQSINWFSFWPEDAQTGKVHLLLGVTAILALFNFSILLIIVVNSFNLESFEKFYLLTLPTELGPSWLTHRVISDRVHRLLVTLSYFRPDRFVQLLSLIPILILLLYYLVSGCLTSLC